MPARASTEGNCERITVTANPRRAAESLAAVTGPGRTHEDRRREPRAAGVCLPRGADRRVRPPGTHPAAGRHCQRGQVHLTPACPYPETARRPPPSWCFYRAGHGGNPPLLPGSLGAQLAAAHPEGMGHPTCCVEGVHRATVHYDGGCRELADDNEAVLLAKLTAALG